MTLENIKKNIYLILLLAFSLLVVWPLFLPGYFSHHDDLQVMRILEMRKCFEDLQIPCRWVSDMGYGYGFPLFNYYGNFPYFVGAALSYIFGYVIAAKWLFFLPIFLGGVGMYLFLRSLSGRFAGLVGGVVYAMAPYRALDVYVRGAISESFALTIIPFLMLAYLKLARKFSLRWFLAAIFLLGAFLISHNIMTIFFTPMIAVWLLYLMIFEERRSWGRLLLSFILGFGVAAYFLLPAFVEKSLVQT